MISREYTVLAQEGLHARPAKELTRLVKRFSCDITLKKDGESFNPRSLISVVTAEVNYMAKITMDVEGADEVECIEALDKFFTQDIIGL